MNAYPSFSLELGDEKDFITLDEYPDHPFAITKCEFNERDTGLLDVELEFKGETPSEFVLIPIKQEVGKLVQHALSEMASL